VAPSRTRTVTVEVEPPSPRMAGLGENAQVRWSGEPAVKVMFVVVLVTPAAV